MVKAYVLIEMAAGRSGDFVRVLINKSEVSSISRVTGPYDVIVIIQGDTLNEVHEFVTDEIHKLDGVLRTTTSVAVG